MKRVSKLLSILFIGMMLFADAVPAMADEGTSGADISKNREAVLQGIEAEGDGTLKKDMPQGEDIYITLADDWRYRWNAEGLAVKDSVIHLDDYKGSNCSFRLYSVTKEYYGIRYEGSTKCFADIKNKSTEDGGILHLYSSSEEDLKDNDQRQFAFYFVDTDECGNEYYYIQNRNSGLWMGYEDKNKSGSPDREEIICQTSKENRKLWIITRGVVPKEGNEAEDLIACREGSTDKEDGVFVSMFRKDSLDCVTSDGDLALNGTSLHFYRMGTNSKMLLIWNHNHSAYEIRYYTDGENYREAVWDLESEGTTSNADVHLWDEQLKSENKNTSQLWRFYRQDDGSYLIKNAKTGKYIGYQYDKDDEGKNLEDSGTLKQLDTGEGTFGDDVRKLAYFTVDRIAGTDNPVNFNYSVDWMADIPDDALLSSINIPGTHDTGTASVNFDASGQASLSSCQKYFYGEQLNVGARSFDIRCDADGDDASLDEINIIHGNSLTVCHERGTDFTALTLQSILNDSLRFLKNHPTESIILTIKPDAGSQLGLAKALGTFIKNNKSYFWTDGGIPTMGEARGKIVLFRRYQVDYDYAKDGIQLQWYGPDLTEWDSHSYSDYEYAIPIYNDGGQSVYVQDAYNKGSDDKLKYIEGTLKQTTRVDKSHDIAAGSWVYNYTSCASGFPLGLSRDINPWLYSGDGRKYFDNRRLGMVMLNFADCQLTKLVYETNFAKGSFFELKSSAPSKVAWTYGDPIGNAEISGQTGKGTWSFDKPDYIPTYEDYKNGTKFAMTFTPDDTSTYRTVTAEVQITDLIKRPISVDIDDKEMTYGDEIPEFTYSVDTSRLVGDDTVTDLNISLDIDKLYSTTGRLRAGQYMIKGSSSSAFYDVNFMSTADNNGSLFVRRKELVIEWSDTSNLVYNNGKPVDVTAEPVGILDGDDCDIYVTGGNETGPSWSGNVEEKPTIFTATAHLRGEDRLNYVLPEAETSKKYYIRRADPSDFNMPTEAVMTYGQKLSEAELELASGDGKFIFIKDRLSGEDIGNTVPEAKGTYEYLIKYEPSDSTVKPAFAEIPVTVNPKKITVKAVPGEKVYGEKSLLDFEIDNENDSNSLARNDTKEDLKLTLTAVGTKDSSMDGDRIKSPAGLYEIQKKECGNDNYEVTVTPAEYRILKKTVDLVWSEQTSFRYNGEPVNVTASAQGLLPGDFCEVNVENGDRIQPGTYVAKAVSLTNDNYKLPDDESLLSREYVITGSADGGDNDSDGDKNGGNGNGSNDTNGTDEIDTSDSMHNIIELCTLLLCLSLAGIISTIVYGRRRRS